MPRPNQRVPRMFLLWRILRRRSLVDIVISHLPSRAIATALIVHGRPSRRCGNASTHEELATPRTEIVMLKQRDDGVGDLARAFLGRFDRIGKIVILGTDQPKI